MIYYMGKKKNNVVEKNEEDILITDGSDDIQKKPAVEAELFKELVIAEDCDSTRELYDKSRYGELGDNNKNFQYSLVEGLYLLERGRLNITKSKNKSLSVEDFYKKARRSEPNFNTRYTV